MNTIEKGHLQTTPAKRVPSPLEQTPAPYTLAVSPAASCTLKPLSGTDVTARRTGQDGQI